MAASKRLFGIVSIYLNKKIFLPPFNFRMFENRVPHMLDDDYTPYSALDIFVKDLVSMKYPLTTLKEEFVIL